MQYDLNQLASPETFQRLVNAILTARFGEDARLTPLQGADGGIDGETPSGNPHMVFKYDRKHSIATNPLIEPPRSGRYVFQAKFHRTGDQRLSDLRTTVLREFKQELQQNVLDRPDRHDVNYFFLVTNVPSSETSINRVDEIRSNLLPSSRSIHADVWWGERITAALDWSPTLWPAFPEIFPASLPPVLAGIMQSDSTDISRKFRVAISEQYRRDSVVKFRQIELERKLFDLFVDLDVELYPHSDEVPGDTIPSIFHYIPDHYRTAMNPFTELQGISFPNSALSFLIHDQAGIQRILLEGGPGQGKSTISQMAAQIYRTKILRHSSSNVPSLTWYKYCQPRLPIRLELRAFSQWMADVSHGTLEQYIAQEFSRDSGGTSVTVDDLHTAVQRSAVILLLDGLDEIGSDALRDRVLDAITTTMQRFEEDLSVDLKVVLTTRPPALTGRRDKLDRFIRLTLTPMKRSRIDDYVRRWLHTQVRTDEEQHRIRQSFDRRRQDLHVQALARNPMQLSVLLQFIYLKGEAFPDRRAELYRDYFQIVIDRDVEKSRKLRENRDLIEGLHSFLGFQLHGAAEIDIGRRRLNRTKIIKLAAWWLEQEGVLGDLAEQFFALGEERFGLIVAVSGGGSETTYGFEIQPIQEYFAASYISNRLPSRSAHSIFESLVHRNYWREVALFLAGLRRPNEKADLIARAKSADRDVSHGWRQNGRGIVVELLREGVLNHPKHVLREAIEVISELLDVKILRVQRNPETIVGALGELGKLYPDSELAKRILQVAMEHSDSDDQSVVSIIHRLASQVLSGDEYARLVREYSGKIEQNRSLVRMTCLYGLFDIIEALATRSYYWEDVAGSVWARTLWRCVQRSGVVLDLQCPATIHRHLVLQFSTSHILRSDRDRRIVEIRASQFFAVWKLEQNLQIVRSYLSADRSDELDRTGSEDSSLGNAGIQYSDEGISYDPLSTCVASCLRDLVARSSDMIASLNLSGHPNLGQKITLYLEAIATHLGDVGISSWVACRCGLEFVRIQSSLGDVTFNRDTLDKMYERLSSFYPISPGRFLRHYHFRGRIFGTPWSMRLVPGRDPIPVYRIISDLVLERGGPTKHSALSWAAEIPLSRAVIKSLVESCRGDLSKLLMFVGERTVIPYPSRPRLIVNDTRRILRICRNTDDHSILKGAATMLFHTKFSRIAESDLIVKILSASPLSQLASLVLNPTRRRTDSFDSYRRGKEFTLSRNVAHRILKNPDRYPFRMVSLSAAFVAETEGSYSVPLFQERPNLSRRVLQDIS